MLTARPLLCAARLWSHEAAVTSLCPFGRVGPIILIVNLFIVPLGSARDPSPALEAWESAVHRSATRLATTACKLLIVACPRPPANPPPL